MDSYQYLSRPNPTDISFDISSALLGSLCLVLFDDLANDFSIGVSMGLLFPTCIVDALGVPECSFEGDGAAAIWDEGWTIFNGFG